MNFTEFAFRVLLLFFPGLVGILIMGQLTIQKKKEPFFFLLQALVLGVVSYFLTWLLYDGWCRWLNERWSLGLPMELSFFADLQDSKRALHFTEIAAASIIAVFVSLVGTYCSNRRFLFRFARCFGLSNKTGALDVWGYVMESPRLVFVTVRDEDRDISYDGWIEAFSETEEKQELLLRDVGVYRGSDSAFLYQVGAMYLKLDPKKILLEFRGVPVNTKHQITVDNEIKTIPSEPAVQSIARGRQESGSEPRTNGDPASSSSSQIALESSLRSEKAVAPHFPAT
jgi:hypothetical protein